jgi:L-alanine-DL-glutamate epimerase-like enolase superfamily enzyme
MSGFSHSETPITRRTFLSLAAGAADPRAVSATAAIDRISLATVEGRFHKFVAMNSYDRAPKGYTYPATLIRIHTNQAIEGIGAAAGSPNAADRERLRSLVGADPLALYEMAGGRIIGRAVPHKEVLSRYRYLDGPLFDLIGKLTGRPAWKLLGESVRERVEAYDGTLYFSDVWFRDRGVRAVIEEAEEAQEKGYVGIKLKVGRSFRWMDPEEGLRRDIEVVRAVWKAVGPKIRIMADANNAYASDSERAWRFVAETADANLHWYEELFPEEVGRYEEFRAKMQKAGVRSLIADGESVRDRAVFDPYLRPRRLIDVLQMDIRVGGFLDNMAVGKMAEAVGAVAIPHNWASQIGGLMGLQVAKAVSGIPAAEDDRSTCDAIIAEGYVFRDGSYSVPDRPGMSIRIDESMYQKKYKAREVIIA